jgi:protein SCO1/2
MEGRLSEARAGGGWALIAMAAIGIITFAWWALALWPASGDPEWLARARAVCFNAGSDGMPDASGWLLLIGQPIGMLAFLLIVWPRSVYGALAGLAAKPAGRVVLAAAVALVVAGAIGVSLRVADAAENALPALLADPRSPDQIPRLDRPASGLGLVNQRGEMVELADLAGRPAIVTFAFGHCSDICPAVVTGVRAARDRAAESRGHGATRLPIVVVTLDPWRDTPARLPELAARWELGAGDHLLSGPVGRVEAVLDGWNVARQRNPATGDVAHTALVLLLDGEGRIAYGTVAAGPETLAELIERI